MLQGLGVEPRIIAYLEQPPSIADIKLLVEQLGLSDVRALMRQGETEYLALGLASPALTQDQLIEVLAVHPRLMERPVFVNNQRAVIARPPELVLALL